MHISESTQAAFRLWLDRYGRIPPSEIARQISNAAPTITPEAALKLQEDFKTALSRAYDIWQMDYERDGQMLSDLELRLREIAPWLDDSNIRGLWRLACWCRAKG